MNDVETLFYNVLKKTLEELKTLNNKLVSIEEELGNIKRRM